MKTKLFFLLAVVAIALLPTTLFAQSASTSASGSATILTPISIANTVGLNFGSMTPGTAGGTCVLSTNAAARTKTGDVILLTTLATAANAHFTVGGEAGAAYTITLPSSLTVTHATIPAQTMTADNFLAYITSISAEGTIGTLTGGADSFDVGATLHVGAAQVNGVYNGSFNVSVTYN